VVKGDPLLLSARLNGNIMRKYKRINLVRSSFDDCLACEGWSVSGNGVSNNGIEEFCTTAMFLPCVPSFRFSFMHHVTHG
jgi:hypothetical protein